MGTRCKATYRSQRRLAGGLAVFGLRVCVTDTDTCGFIGWTPFEKEKKNKNWTRAVKLHVSKQKPRSVCRAKHYHNKTTNSSIWALTHTQGTHTSYHLHGEDGTCSSDDVLPPAGEFKATQAGGEKEMNLISCSTSCSDHVDNTQTEVHICVCNKSKQMQLIKIISSLIYYSSCFVVSK